MAHTSVKITANSSDYRTQMKSAAAQMKELSSEYSLAATRARLTGSAMDALKAKAESLTQKVTVQRNIVQMNREQQERLTEQLGKQKTKQEELKTKVDAAKKAYEDEKKATGENSDATKALKEELDKLAQEFKENETVIGRTETALSKQTVSTNRAETALVEMEAELEDINRELKNHNLNAFADACDKAGQKIEQFGKRMMVVSAGIATFATASAKMAVDFEDSIAKVSTIMDEGVMSVDEMEDAIISLSNETGIAAGDIADNVYNAISAGQDTADAVNFVRESTKLATAGFAESGDTLDILTTILNAYGLEAEKVTEVSDMLVQTQNLGKTTVSELSSAMGKVIPTANANNVALDQLCAGYAIMTANGVATAETTTYMNSMLNELGKTGSTTDVILREKTGKSFSELMQSGSSLADVLQIIDGAAKEENFTMSDMFSSAEAAKAGLILLGDSADSFNGTLAEMRQSTGATDLAFEKMQTTSYDIKIAMNELKNTMMQFGQTIMSSAAPLVEQFTEKVHTLCEWFGSLDEGQQQTILKIGLFTAAVGPAAIGIGKFAQGISTTIKGGQKLTSWVSGIITKITAKTAATAAGTAATTAHAAATTAATTTTGAMTVAQGALNTVMNLCPIILIVTLIAGLIAAGVALYKNWDKVKEKLSELWGHIKEKFDAIKEKITGVFKNAKEVVTNKVSEMKNAITNSAIGQAASKAFSTVKSIVSNLTGAATETVKQNLSNMKTAYEEQGGGIKGIVAAGWEGIEGYYSAGFTFVDKLTGGKLTEIKTKFSDRTSEIKEKVSEGWTNMKETVNSKMTEWKTNASSKLDEIRTNFTKKVSGIQTYVATGWSHMRYTITSTMQQWNADASAKLTSLKQGFDSKVNNLKTKVSEGWTNMKTSISTKMQQWNADASKKLTALKTNFSLKVNEIKSDWTAKYTEIKDKATSLMEAAKTNVSKKLEAMRSNFSSKLETIKSNWSSGYENIKSTATLMMEAAKSNISSKLESIKSDFSSKLNNALSTVSSVMENIRAKFSEKMEAAKSVVSGAIEKIKGFFNFEWSLPSIKLPHFSISGSFSLNPPSIPSFGVEWYRTGGIMTNPTVFGMNGTRLMIGGEAGAEAILPLSEFYTKLNNMLDRKINAINQQIKAHVEVHTYIDSDEVSNRTTEKVSENLAIERLKRR